MNSFLYHIFTDLSSLCTIVPVLVAVILFYLDKPSNKIKIKIVIVFTGIFFALSEYSNNLVEMPNITGDTYTNVNQTLNNLGLELITDKEINNPYEWIVSGQSVEKGKYVLKGSKVYVYVESLIVDNTTELNDNSRTDVSNYLAIGSNTENISNSTDDNWSIEILNEIDNPVVIGTDLIIDLDINTPTSQYSTPYILYAAYFNEEIWDWEQYFALKIPPEQSHLRLTIDTYLLGIPTDQYFFTFDLFRSEDYSAGNSCASTVTRIKLSGESVTFEDDVFDRDVVEYEFLDYYTIHGQEYPKNTERLSLIDVDNTDIKNIACLTNLTELNISGSEITDIEPLRKLSKLESFSVHSNKLYAISAIEDMPNLTHLSIGGENYNGTGTHGVLEDITPIQNLKYLTILTIYDCNVKDISCIKNLKMLEYISIFKTKVEDISALSELRFIKELKLHRNNISDITPLDNIPNLTRLTISYNKLNEEQIDTFKETHPNCSVYSKE